MVSSGFFQLTLDARAVPEAASVYATLAADSSSRLQRNETCTTLAREPLSSALANCRFPRTCRSCLQKSGCLVHPSGLCVDPTVDDYMTLRNYGYADSSQISSPARQRYFFPAARVDYCDDADATSAACRTSSAFATANDSRFCVGAGGCVRISNCMDETALPVGKIVVVCSSSPFTAGGSAARNDSMSVVVEIMAVVVGTLVILAGMLIVRLRRMARARRAREAELTQLRDQAQQARSVRRNKSAQLGVGELQLVGWRSHRETAANDVDTPYMEIYDTGEESGDNAGIVPRELQPVRQNS